ncbi:MAG: hypothetical protein KKD44_27450 [Proteobacteria bacterium]|nr:hypothetical protein [Pseudomonadota bacterium]
MNIFKNKKRMNKKGVLPVIAFIWALTALGTIGFVWFNKLVQSSKPATPTISTPVIIIIIVIIILLLRRR